MTNKKLLGNWGEDQALKYLLNRDYQLVARNWRHKRQELDLLVVTPRLLIAVEVKTRRSPLADNQPLLSLAQITRLRRALKSFCCLHNYPYQKTRLDLITIIANSKHSFNLNHYQDL
ncbi:MAG: YraN family protein [Candidatus Parcubacteria bacterium]|jgi:putative endonuclease|nr:MAG: hypothetical protein JST_6350 [Candidatus Parcubacteria bacterium]